MSPAYFEGDDVASRQSSAGCHKTSAADAASPRYIDEIAADDGSHRRLAFAKMMAARQADEIRR